MRFGLLLIFIVAFPSLTQSIPPIPQQTKDGKKEDSIIVCNQTCLAIVYVKVVDGSGKEILTLSRDDFLVYEDGVQQDINHMWRNDNYKQERKQARYQLGYYPTNEKFDGKYRKINVTVQAKDVTKWKVQVFPKGYHANLVFKNSEQEVPSRVVRE